MDFLTRDIGPHKLLCINGEIDLYNVGIFKKALFDIIATNIRSLIIDMKNIPYMDSSGIGALVAGQKKMKMKKGYYALLNIQSDVLNILKLATLDKFFKIFSNEIEIPQQIITPTVQIQRPALKGFRRRPLFPRR